MQHDRIHRVIYVETALAGSEVRDTFSQYGRIRDIYPCKNGPHRDFARYFVEFEHENSAKGARNLESPRYSVHIPAHSPRLASCFWDIVSPEQTSPVSKRDISYQASGSVDRPNCRRTTHIPRLSSPGKKGVSRTYMRPSGSKLESGPESPKRPVWTSPVRNRQSDHEKENRAVTPPSRQHVSLRHETSTPLKRKADVNPRQFVPGFSTPHPRNPDMSAMTSWKAIKPEPDVDASLTSQEDTRGVSKPVLSEPQPVAPSTSPVITLSHDGSRYSCPLDEFTEDPANAITVLTQTAAGSSERDKWMIVAAHCRRKQKV
ncbi:hypothetical protein PHLGIDRAFT_187128 [Phlebiopsis gigantea 11061_1 CR5-6]|uniref:RRM domain-containing protein n=1 Tax=Phlebiopsis gigantea (strain 11061_1 CR5-6) TaxID=745531 RepID=A0A0C3PTQ9_PHLG1|nr:hypothetical protein PHLGIDRAFT_187128 [Phlebiopsis gigantea 11061_1 CR5-6]